MLKSSLNRVRQISYGIIMWREKNVLKIFCYIKCTEMVELLLWCIWVCYLTTEYKDEIQKKICSDSSNRGYCK